MKNSEFYRDVKRMRELQKEYFKTKSAQTLEGAKFYEKEVDKHISKTEQPELFQ